MTNFKRREGEHWAVDKRVPLALIFTIAFQTIGLIVFLTNLDNRITVVEKDMSAKSGQSESIIRIDEQMKSLRADMVEIKALLRQPQPTAVVPRR